MFESSCFFVLIVSFLTYENASTEGNQPPNIMPEGW